MIYSVLAALVSSGASSYGCCKSPQPSVDNVVVFNPLEPARMLLSGRQNIGLSPQMLRKDSHPLTASVSSGVGILSPSARYSRHFLTLRSFKRSFKPGGSLSFVIRFQNRKTAVGFTCRCCRADLRRTSGEKQYQPSAEALDESDRVSLWDSNAENIRRSRRNSRPSSYVRPDERAPENWDYAADTESESDNWQWWRISKDDDTYEDDTDDEEDMGFSWLNFDIKSALPMLGWMIPTAFVFLPWLLGSPMLITMAIAFFPLMLKLLGPVLPESWGVLLQSWNSASAKSKQKRGRRPAVSNKDGTTSRFYREKPSSGFSEWANGSSDDSDLKAGFDVSSSKGRARPFRGNKSSQGQRFKLGGWNELQEDTSGPGKLTRYNRKEQVVTRRKRKEVPLFFRLLIALFPFLRSWGGFL